MPAATARAVVVVCGGAVAGSELAAVCARRGMLVVVLERGATAYGKIDDGLPAWHVALRAQERARVDRNLTTPSVLFLPRTALGADVPLAELRDLWRPSAVVLANGAWRDRRLAVPGIDAFVGHGLVYQNDFVRWFNGQWDPCSSGPSIDVPDDPVVIGGGLAAIDCCKMLSILLHGRALRAHGERPSVVELERDGIPKAFARRGLDASTLGVRPVRLFYRRAKGDMPLAELPPHPTEADVARVTHARAQVMDVCASKYRIALVEHRAPHAAVVADGRLRGIAFRRTDAEAAEGDCEIATSALVVSSIGSIPEPVAGIPPRANGEGYASRSTGTGGGPVEGLEDVYIVGNAVTGRGNLHASRADARTVGEELCPRVLDADAVGSLLARVADRWRAVGYDGDYGAWIRAVTARGSVGSLCHHEPDLPLETEA